MLKESENNMERFGFNINYKMAPEHIRKVGEACLGSDLYQAIEVTYYEHMEHLDTTEYNQAVRDIIQAYHPQVLVHISGFNLSEENHTIRRAIFDEIEHCILYTAALGGKEVVIHSGSSSDGMHVPILHADNTIGTAEEMYDKAWKLTVEMLQRACDKAEAYGVTLYTENLFGGRLTETTESLQKLLKDVGRSNLKIVFDVGHGNYLGKDPYTEVMHAGKELKHLHIHDNHGIGPE
ncbi:MAG: sugar phosphate isomerase/epimerase, partial [Lachnospiraceae bacterium]|nr:sugar phosphate isomerase/epimerase [Lachnospiraceae bacterium]